MSEETNPDDANLDNYTKNKVKEGIENLLEEKELKIKWRKELESNPAVVEYFKSYYGNPMQTFIDNYLNTKYLYHTYGDKYREMLEKKRDQWINEAHKQLEYILQKQLFDKQCLWRAKQIEIEGVAICFDFKMWESNVLNCPFLEPISEIDIKIYQDFLTSSNLNPDHLESYDWQDYDQIKKAYTSNKDDEYDIIPDWYEFHNNRTGNGSLLILPNNKGIKENFYIELRHEIHNKNREESETESVIEVDTRPFLSSYDPETLAFFVNTFEDFEAQKKYKYYAEGSRKDADFDFQYTLDRILGTDDYIPVEAHYDVKQAILIAYHKYYCKKIAEHLPMAHEQYLFHKKMGFVFENEREDFYANLRGQMIKLILKGRVLNGEPDNLDF
jgi:hypothetical protein